MEELHSRQLWELGARYQETISNLMAANQRETRHLLDRIQAPETAVAQPHPSEPMATAAYSEDSETQRKTKDEMDREYGAVTPVQPSPPMQPIGATHGDETESETA
jgi:hypothetical protein